MAQQWILRNTNNDLHKSKKDDIKVKIQQKYVLSLKLILIENVSAIVNQLQANYSQFS